MERLNKSKILNLIGAGAIAVGNLVYPQTAQAQEQSHPFNSRSREVLLVCANENQPVNFYPRTLWDISVNGRDFVYGGNFAVVIGNMETNQAYLAVAGSDDLYRIFSVTGSLSNNLIEKGEVVTVDKSDASFTPGVYRYRHPKISNLQRYTFDEHRENLIEECFTTTRSPQYPFPR